MPMIRNINPSLGDTVKFADVEEMAAAIAACGYTTEDGEMVEGRDYATVSPCDVQVYSQTEHPTREYVSFGGIISRGPAEPTGRLLAGSSDSGYAQEWSESATLMDGRPGELIYLLTDAEAQDIDGLDWEGCYKRFRLGR